MSDCRQNGCSCAGLETAPRQRLKSLSLKIPKLDCPTEEGLIRKGLGQLPGVSALEFNLLDNRLKVSHSLDDTAPIYAALERLGLPAERPAGLKQSVLTIPKMDCPTEEKLIRERLMKMAGVENLEFNLMQRRLTVSHSLAEDEPIKQALKQLGLPAADEIALPRAVKHWQGWLLGLAGLAMLAAEILSLGGFRSEAAPSVIALSLIAVAAGGLPTFKKGLIALKNLNLNMNVLMTIAVVGAVAIGEWSEAAMVTFLFAVSELVEARSLDRARSAIHKLMALAPETALVKQADGSWREVAASAVAVDAVVRVQPGDKIALDGVIVAGSSSVDQASITGESLPVSKSVGDQVFAGTLNQSGSFDFRVTAAADASTLSRIIAAVEQAQAGRAPIERFVDEFARIYTPTVFMIAIVVAVLPPLIFAQPWLVWIYKALVLLMIACPCALVISTPVTVVSGLAAAARQGLLIKGGAYLELGRKLKVLAFDKTGTLTEGKPSVTDYLDLQPGSALNLAAALAARSDHPVSRAVETYWQAQAAGELPEVADFEALSGRGSHGRIAGSLYYLGNHRLIEELGLCSPELENRLDELERQAKTTVLVASETAVLALIAVADRLKPSSGQAIAELHALGVSTMLLSGDNPHTVTAIARELGIDYVRGNQLPEDKLVEIGKAQERYGTVGMVGDGINDAPALARASIGFAMGAAGSDIALETADVALMDDDPRKLARFVRLSRRAAGLLKQNIAIALAIKAIVFVLALMGQATLWMAVFADMGASLIVVFNGLRALKPPRK
ncbi:MAG: putative cadmium-transporting ATPase [Deltaproteobacteria bacterium ADurb.Bin510]|nr:MAG: putative cadmium-transporting ATPase [Deltaproteobacteria bacterium ADurb.Bin510]